MTMMRKLAYQLKLFKRRFPLVRRSTHEKMQKNYEYALDRRSKNYDEELAILQDLITEHLPKLTHAYIGRDDSRRMFKVSVVFDEYLITRSFAWGNNQRELQYIAQFLGYEIAKELVGINSSRYAQSLVTWER